MADNILLFTGSEPLLINSKIERVLKNTHVDEYNLLRYDCEETNIGKIIQDALTPPFLSDVKVVIIKNPLFLTAEKSTINHDVKAFINYVQKPMESTLLIINATNLKLSERLEVVKTLKKHAKINETKEMDEIEYSGWLRRQCDLEGVAIRDDAVKQFINIVGRDLTNAKNEVDKLVAYVGRGGKITTKEVNNITSKTMQNNIYALTSSIIEKDKKKALKTYIDLITSGNDVMRLFNLTVRTIKDTLIANLYLQEGAKQTDIATKFNISTNKAYYLVKNAKTLSLDTAKETINKLAVLDYKIKSGQVDIKSGFECFLLAM